MKTYIYAILLAVAGLLSACSDEQLNSESIFDVSEKQRSKFDTWILENYVNPYNIDFKYRMEHIESDFSYNLVPAEFSMSVKLAKIVKHAWLEGYDEAAGGTDFMRANVPKVIHLIGSAAWSRETFVVGTAEGGLKVTLYLGNWLTLTDPEQLNKYYFHTMHHEFAHILHQKKRYPVEYDKISAGNYTPSGWHNRELKEVAPLGFVTPYAGSQPSEDIAELTACYLTYSDAAWKDLMGLAGEKGKPIIDRKLELVRKYMKESWAIDLGNLRKIILRRSLEIVGLNFDL